MGVVGIGRKDCVYFMMKVEGDLEASCWCSSATHVCV